MASPTLWQRALFRCLPFAERVELQADMLELYADRRAQAGALRAVVWLVLHTILVALRLRWHTASSGVADVSGLWLDLKHVTRGLRASRMFTAVAIVSLAIGIGANASIYSVIRTLLLDEMAVPNPDELSLVYWNQTGDLSVSQMNSSSALDPATGQSLRSNISYPLLREMLTVLPESADGFGFTFMRSINLSAGNLPAGVGGGLAVDSGYFRVMSPPMALGRPFGVDDDRDDAPAVVVLSHSFFTRTFGADPDVLGTTIRVNGQLAQVVGVTAPSFRGLSKGGFFPATDVTVPLRLFSALRNNSTETSLMSSEVHLWVRLMLRLPHEEMKEALAPKLASLIPAHTASVSSDDAGTPVVVLHPGGRGLDQTRDATRRLLLILMGVVVIVLLIACVNLAGLMLARGVARQNDMALRRALGAGRYRLVRALVLEGWVLAFAGGLAGLFLTFLSRRVLTSLLTSGLGTAPMSQQALEVSIDLPLVVATFGVSAVAAVFFSLLPAIRLTATDRGAGLKHHVVGAPTPKLTLGRVLVALQIGVSVPLLVVAILFLRTVANLNAVDVGFEPAGLSFFKVDPIGAGVAEDERASTLVRIVRELQAVPGVTSVTLVENALLSGITSSNRTVVDGVEHSMQMNAVGPDFLDTMGVTLLAGRAIGLQDGPGAPPTAMINESGARALFGTTAVVGRTIPWANRTLEIVGVVGDTRYSSPRNAVRPILFDSALQRSGYGGHNVVVKSRESLVRLEPEFRRAIADVNRDIPVPEIRTQTGQIETASMRERVFAQLLTIFGGFALLLVSIGLHSVTSYSVQRRTNEIGVRMALGAQPGQVLWLIQRQVVVLAAIGLVIGVPAALAAGPLFSALLFGVAPTSVPVLVVGAGVMLIVALAAGWMPAHRAARVDPLTALRAE